MCFDDEAGMLVDTANWRKYEKQLALTPSLLGLRKYPARAKIILKADSCQASLFSGTSEVLI